MTSTVAVWRSSPHSASSMSSEISSSVGVMLMGTVAGRERIAERMAA
ncbi:hypothetical protein [Streptomyces sp. 2A115]